MVLSDAGRGIRVDNAVVVYEKTKRDQYVKYENDYIVLRYFIYKVIIYIIFTENVFEVLINYTDVRCVLFNE